jgi:hypothetical protein
MDRPQLLEKLQEVVDAYVKEHLVWADYKRQIDAINKELEETNEE